MSQRNLVRLAAILAISRTAYGPGENAAHRQHDANYLTFHHFANFRNLSPKNSVQGVPKDIQ